MLRVALSGGIGSGKSVVTSILRALGAKVVVADEVNAALLADPKYIDRIADIFPSVVHNHSIDKKELASLVYADEGKRRLLMSVAHPLIFERMFSLYAGEQVVFYEVPLLSEYRELFDLIWFVDASEEDRIRRVMARDGVTEARAKRILSLQSAEDKLRDTADFVILNHGGLDELRESVERQYYLILKQFS
ncbi:MAG: dephospho-CoA kinase [Clostridia bacterium]|nr:dephospho-CoA kinase [Clostridia bacterium]